MSEEHTPGKWSQVSREQKLAYMNDATRIVESAKGLKVHPFAAAVAGVILARTALKQAGESDVWAWQKLLDPSTDAEAFLAGEDLA
jgi:hypothetical protein